MRALRERDAAAAARAERLAPGLLHRQDAVLVELQQDVRPHQTDTRRRPERELLQLEQLLASAAEPQPREGLRAERVRVAPARCVDRLEAFDRPADPTLHRADRDLVQSQHPLLLDALRLAWRSEQLEALRGLLEEEREAARIELAPREQLLAGDQEVFGDHAAVEVGPCATDHRLGDLLPALRPGHELGHRHPALAARAPDEHLEVAGWAGDGQIWREVELRRR